MLETLDLVIAQVNTRSFNSNIILGDDSNITLYRCLYIQGYKLHRYLH